MCWDQSSLELKLWSFGNVWFPALAPKHQHLYTSCTVRCIAFLLCLRSAPPSAASQIASLHHRDQSLSCFVTLAQPQHPAKFPSAPKLHSGVYFQNNVGVSGEMPERNKHPSIDIIGHLDSEWLNRTSCSLSAGDQGHNQSWSRDRGPRQTVSWALSFMWTPVGRDISNRSWLFSKTTWQICWRRAVMEPLSDAKEGFGWAAEPIRRLHYCV